MLSTASSEGDLREFRRWLVKMHDNEKAKVAALQAAFETLRVREKKKTKMLYWVCLYLDNIILVVV